MRPLVSLTHSLSAIKETHLAEEAFLLPPGFKFHVLMASSDLFIYLFQLGLGGKQVKYKEQFSISFSIISYDLKCYFINVI